MDITECFPEGQPPHVYANLLSIDAWKEYRSNYVESIGNSSKFWAGKAVELLTWFKHFTRVSGGDFTDGDMHWFDEGKLNACYNCVDRHLPHRADKTAIIWESDEPGEGRHITYAELAKEVGRIANAMRTLGVRKGDVVTVYMPMIPELAMVMLACAKIGAIHSVVFAGFSAESLRYVLFVRRVTLSIHLSFASGTA
jgi:acetyl-CoA synthetase